MEMPLEFNSRAAWSSNCSRRDLAAESRRRAVAAFLLTRRTESVLDGAALGLGFGSLHAPAGDQIVQGGFDVLMARGVVREYLLVHRALVGEFPVTVDD